MTFSFTTSYVHTDLMKYSGVWSSGMILASGFSRPSAVNARGPGFESQLTPMPFFRVVARHILFIYFTSPFLVDQSKLGIPFHIHDILFR